VSDFSARGKRGTSSQQLRTFPAYGALLGVLVPEGVDELEVSIEPRREGWASACAVLGFFMLAALSWWVRRQGVA
jgi:hypothetical protein